MRACPLVRTDAKDMVRGQRVGRSVAGDQLGRGTNLASANQHLPRKALCTSVAHDYDLITRPDDRSASRNAMAHGVEAPALSMYATKSSVSGLVLGYAGLAEDEVTQGVRYLGRALVDPSAYR